MAAKDSNHELLTSWKEIAEYLKCDIKTCYRWEKNAGLPIHRVDIEGTTRSRVYAYRSELDNWLKRQEAEVDVLRKNRVSPSWQRGKSRFIIPVLLIIFISTLIAVILTRTPDNPANFRFFSTELIILNQKGGELWRFQTSVENLIPEASYRARFQVKGKSEEGVPLSPLLIIKDLGRDNKAEVLFTIKTRDEQNEGLLFCFNPSGKLLWKFQAGRELTFGSNLYSADYRIIGVEVADLNHDGQSEIIVLSTHWPQWPCQLAILDNHGQMLGEYWNSGHLNQLAFADLDGNGPDEIIAGGVNNEYRKGCLVVIDSSRAAGSSPQSDPEYACKSLGKGAQKFYILLPRTEVDLDEYPIESVKAIHILKNRHISIEMHYSHIFFDFGPSLTLSGLPQSSHSFEILYKKVLEKGKASHVLDREYWQSLADGILYYDGQNWTSNPMQNVHWKGERNSGDVR